jgi:ABC-2 type transport system ATP-binding protein
MMAAPDLEELRRMPGVMNVESLGGVRYRIRFDEAHDISERIIETSVARGWRLTDIILEKSSLDHIFAALSKK